MKNYLERKLKKVEDRIESIKRSILQDLSDMKISQIVSSAQELDTLKKVRIELVKDLAEYLTVSEVIELHKKGVVFTAFEISYQYRYNRAVTVSERDILIEHFGHHLKDVKIK